MPNTQLPSLTLPALTLDTAEHDFAVGQWRSRVESSIDTYITAGGSVRSTIYARSDAIDTVLCQLFEHVCLTKDSHNAIALFAVGGYGRKEMLPFSDVDIMLLSENALTAAQSEKVEHFVTKLWDLKLNAGVSVRSISDCVNEAADISVATSLLESRLIIGNTDLASTPKKIATQAWSDKDFFTAKKQEQRQRYIHHSNTEYSLEPNIKNAPGGLRDIHHIGWICKRYFRVNKLSDLIHQSFLTDSEYDELLAAEDFLLTLRHYLHRVAGRAENKLLFDFQRDISQLLGYHKNLPAHAHPNADIEAMMRVYYRQVMRISTLNEMLTAYYYESLIEPRLPEDEKPTEQIINDDFRIINNAIAVRHSKVFSQNPNALLHIFVLMAEKNISQIRAKTLRLLKSYAHLIDADFRSKPENRAAFVRIIAEPKLLFVRLRKMKRFGVLGRYLPAFEKVIGLMQYDLFHRYTVDAHTLLLMRILHRFTDEQYADTYSTVAGIYKKMERKDLLHLAALFHDIAKGRGGDHSELGAADAHAFCQAHGFSDYDAKLVAWLVQYHLLMSMTAQKRDISDPEVVRAFAEKVGDMVHLNYLYVLTVADMNATNPELWNSWRASLLKQLYTSARRMLRAGLAIAIDKEELISTTKAQAKTLLSSADDVASIEQMWQELGDDYFLRENPSDIVWHTRAILAHGTAAQPHEPLVLVREHKELALDAVQVFVYAKDMPNLFASTVSVFHQMNLDVQDARIITATRDFALDSYVLIDRHGTLLQDKSRENMLIDAIKHSLTHAAAPKIVHQRIPRQLKHFHVPTKINAYENENAQYHELVIETLDQPGLLANIACAFLRHDIEVHAARITTLGEKAQDVFMISDRQDKPLSKTAIQALTHELLSMLKQPESGSEPS